MKALIVFVLAVFVVLPGCTSSSFLGTSQNQVLGYDVTHEYRTKDGIVYWIEHPMQDVDGRWWNNSLAAVYCPYESKERYLLASMLGDRINRSRFSGQTTDALHAFTSGEVALVPLQDERLQ